MLHTFQLETEITYSQYSYLLNNLPSLRQVGERTFVSNYYKKKGVVQIDLQKWECSKYVDIKLYKYYLTVRFNLSAVMNEHTYTLLKGDRYSADEIAERIIKRLYEINELRYVTMSQKNINDYITVRMDFAEDIEFQYPDLLAYLCNMSFPYRHYGMKPFTPHNKMLSAYLYESCCFGNKSRKFNLYRKMSDIINNDRFITDDERKSLTNLFRFEIQIMRRGIRTISQNLLTKKIITPFLDEHFCFNYILKQAIKVFKEEPYVCCSEAQKIICNSSYNERDKQIMLSIIRMIPVCNGLYWLEKAVDDRESLIPSSYGDLKTFRRYLKKIRSLGIQPVTIPDEYAIQHNIQEIPSIAELIKSNL
ncbi:MAG: hypothetical protein J6C96_11095 [Oscillospiraceae bacterium]|nr:hypothetical protein [Oscillospiraceae bacterium]